jgi:hypothetical protein
MKDTKKKYERAIVSLLMHTSVKEAAKDCGLSEVTLWRYLQDEEFQKTYRLARRRIVEQAIANLQGVMGLAVKTLANNLVCDSPQVTNRAAQIILEHGVRGLEIMDLKERVERLEALLSQE